MAQSQSDETLKELTQALVELKVTNNTMVVKMEQIYTSIEKLENSIEKLEKVTEGITSSVSSQERRLAVLEQLIPPQLVHDIAVLKANQATQGKLLWLLGSLTAAGIIQAIFKVL